MAKVILICGRICCGKTTYARQLREERGGVILSVDEIMLSLFGLYAGERHDEYSERLQRLLLDKSLEIAAAGADPILDWGFWTREKRTRAREFYRSNRVPFEFHYIDVSHDVWRERVALRNRQVLSGERLDYYLDEALEAKFLALFEPPEREEMDVWVRN